MTDYTTFDGVIESISVKSINTKNGMQTKTSLKVSGQWFSAFGELNYSTGDGVRITYEAKIVGDKTYNNIKNIDLITNTVGTPYIEPEENQPIKASVTQSVPIRDTHLSILKQVAFKGAIELAKGKDQDNKIILCDADEFYAWLKGEDD